jgi:AcrR family transcriptional regulator
LLARDGLDGLTTNAVARVAGVSIGSLYQYFPDKFAIIVEIARRVEATALSMLAQESMRLRDASVCEAVARVARLSCSPNFGSNELRRALLREVPRGWILSETWTTDSLVGHAISAFVHSRPEQVRCASVHPMVFAVQHALEGVSEAVLLAAPHALPTSEVQRELFHLGWTCMAAEGASLAPPPADAEDLPPLRDGPDADIARRMLAEPSHRRALRSAAEPSSERARTVRLAIVAAAECVLAQKGFDGLSVRSIAREAGISIGAMYRQFPSVQAVISEAAKQTEVRVCGELRTRIDRARNVEQIADAIVSAFTSEELAPTALRRALLGGVPRRWTEETLMALHSAEIDRIAEVLSMGGGSVRAGDHRLMAFFALHAVRSVTESYLLLEPSDFGLAALIDELRELAMRYLRADRP